MEDNQFENEKLDFLRSFIDSKLERDGLFVKLKQQISGVQDEDLIKERIQGSGIIDEIIESFKGMSNVNVPDKRKRGILLKLIKGEDFIDFEDISNDATFTFDIAFLGSRYVSKPIPASCDFNIDQQFLLSLNPTDLNINPELDKLRRLYSPIHIVMLLNEGPVSRTVSVTNIEWRWILCYGGNQIKKELFSCDNKNKMNVGALNVSY